MSVLLRFLLPALFCYFCLGTLRVWGLTYWYDNVSSWQSAASWIGRRIRIKGTKGTGAGIENVRGMHASGN